MKPGGGGGGGGRRYEHGTHSRSSADEAGRIVNAKNSISAMLRTGGGETSVGGWRVVGEEGARGVGGRRGTART